jgi:hypothetical protein
MVVLDEDRIASSRVANWWACPHISGWHVSKLSCDVSWGIKHAISPPSLSPGVKLLMPDLRGQRAAVEVEEDAMRTYALDPLGGESHINGSDTVVRALIRGNTSSHAVLIVVNYQSCRVGCLRIGAMVERRLAISQLSHCQEQETGRLIKSTTMAKTQSLHFQLACCGCRQI